MCNICPAILEQGNRPYIGAGFVICLHLTVCSILVVKDVDRMLFSIYIQHCIFPGSAGLLGDCSSLAKSSCTVSAILD